MCWYDRTWIWIVSGEVMLYVAIAVGWLVFGGLALRGVILKRWVRKDGRI